MNRLRNLLECGWIPSDEKKREILRKRSWALAARTETAAGANEPLEVVEFHLAGERYAIATKFVREVQPLREFTSLPGSPSFVLGLINVRGQLLSVVDLKKFFDLPERGLTDLNKVLVVSAGSLELGILADGIVGVKAIPLPDIQEPLPTLSNIGAEFLRGITKDQLILLDVEKILSHRTMVIHEQVD
jgi:purine-binding chemotaxis protein CheW